MPTFKLTLAYDGTEFSGWQAQPERRTVQGILQDAWQQVTGHCPEMTASSRTDAGVHAWGQTVGIVSGTHLEARQLGRALNANLPEDIVVRNVAEVPDGFHATHHAVGKCYRYRIHNDPLRPLFERRYAWHVLQELDSCAMQTAAEALVGTHDFASFQSAGSPRNSTVRTIQAIQVRPMAECRQIDLVVTGDGFLYKMVRIIAGTLVEIGAGRRAADSMQVILVACDRLAAGKTAPPHGLCLMRVDYPPPPASVAQQA